MQVRIHKDIFNDSSNNDVLNDILAFFRHDRHQLILDDYDDIEAFKSSIWAQKELNSRDLKLINEFIITSTRREKNKLLINLSNQNNQDYFSPREAYLYLNQPLIVLVENAEFEPPFVNAIIKNFDESGVLIEGKKGHWWKYVMDAGSSVKQVINGDIENNFDDEAFVKEKSRYLRYFVLIDSDKEYPSMEVSAVTAKEEYLKRHNVKYHVFFKREKENYLPFNILEGFGEQYFKLYMEFENDEQKDFFDIEKGFKNKNKSDGNWKTEVKELYNFNKISDNDWGVLRKGVSQIEVFSKDKFKADFSRLFANANKIDMLNRISHQPLYDEDNNEFQHIVNQIKAVL